MFRILFSDLSKLKEPSVGETFFVLVDFIRNKVLDLGQRGRRHVISARSVIVMGRDVVLFDAAMRVMGLFGDGGWAST